MPFGYHSCQHTLRRSVRVAGVGLHTGKPVTLRLRPGKTDSGIVFLRCDVAAGTRLIRGHWRHVQSTQLATGLRNAEGLSAITVEHLMAALRGCNVDNAVIEIDGPEVPILDGSSAPLVALIERAGVAPQSQPRRFLRVKRPVEVADGDKSASLSPDDASRFSVTIDFASRAIGRQHFSLELSDGAFKREVAAARTFGFIDQLEGLRNQGLVRGGSLSNAIVIDGDHVVNEGGLRQPDEFVRHKLLDSVGDLFLAGVPIIGHYTATRPGHALNAALLARLFSDPGSYTLTTADELNAELAAPAAG